jgi:pimeloyl-ACP methyl ester carboxylesterase
MEATEPQYFMSGDDKLGYYQSGVGPDVVLLHGFSLSSRMCFGDQHDTYLPAESAATVTSSGPLLDALIAAGARVTMLDTRGHGMSGSAGSLGTAGIQTLVADVSALLDHLDLEAADVVGYSMGAIVLAHLLGRDERVRSAVLGGVGAYVLEGHPTLLFDGVAEAFETDDWSSLPSELTLYREVALLDPANNLVRLGQVYRALATPVPLAGLGQSRCPVLVANGRRDASATDAEQLAAAIPNSRVVWTAGDHIASMSDPDYAAVLIGFLREQWAT